MGSPPTDDGHTTTPQTTVTAHRAKTGYNWDRNGEQRGTSTMRGRQGKKGTRLHSPQPYKPLLIGWITGANSDKG